MKISICSSSACALVMAIAMGTAPAIAQPASHSHVVCHDVKVVHHVPHKDKHRVMGTVIGAVAGGVIGHQVGGGKGKQLATAGGAVAGGFIGHHIQTEHQEHQTYTTVERRCHRVKD